MRRTDEGVRCHCGASIEVCAKCWDRSCPSPVCFSCLLLDSGMKQAELPELVNAVRLVRDRTAALETVARRSVAKGRPPKTEKKVS